jgi:NADH dehydrogenase FAD-containing subunit
LRYCPETLQALLTFILVGGGTAGVEMAGTIAEMARMALAHDFRHIDPRSAHIVLFEAAPRILPGYPEQLSARAHHHLEQLGVRVRTSTKVEDVDASGVVVAGQRIGSHTVLWTAGVGASPAGQWLGVETDRAGRVKVQPDLSVPGDPNIFAIGDTASVVASTRNLFGIRRKEPVPLPGVAQPAIQAGKYVASVIRRRVLGLPVPAPFCYWDKGSLAIVGRTFAVADVPPFRFWGVLAWLLWLDLLYLSPSFIWWQAVAGILGATLSNALCNNSRCTWRYRKGARNVYNTAIRRVLSPLRLCGSVTADVHGCPRGVAPIRRPLAIRDTPVAHTGGATTPSPHHATGCDAHPSVLLSPPGHGFSTLDVR